MSAPSPQPANKHRILVVDDDEDIHVVSRLTLKSLRYRGRRVEILSARSGQECIEVMSRESGIGVILLDVVMETDHAGLDACRKIREDVGNSFSRILLRTGQPGAAPEKKVIQEYDIDGYLPKGELTAARLYTSVRTSLKAYCELVELERHRRSLAAIHDCIVSLRPYEPVEAALERIMDTVLAICPAPLAVMHLATVEGEGNPQQYFLHQAPQMDPVTGEAEAEQIRLHIAATWRPSGSVRGGNLMTPERFENGYLIPLNIDHELGFGWIYVAEPAPDQLTLYSLALLSSHGVNVLYAALAQAIMASREGELFDQMSI